MGSLQLISTDSVSPSDRICLYRQTLWERFGRLESKILGNRPLKATFEYGQIGDIGLCRLKESGHRVERTSASARRSEGYLKVALQIKGAAYFEQAGRGVLLSPGQWSIYDMAKSYTVTVPDYGEILLLMIRRESIVSKRYNIDDLTVQNFSGTMGVGKLACEFISSAFDEISHVETQSEPDIVDTIAHLVRLTMLEFSGDQTVGSQRQILGDRIKSYVLAHLRDPNLSIDQIASSLNCTKRYLHKAFKVEGVSISDYIWQTRLDRCRSDLLNPGCHGQSITDIAFSWGFNSSAHFSTSFKEHFGASPSCYRKEEPTAVPALK